MLQYLVFFERLFGRDATVWPLVNLSDAPYLVRPLWVASAVLVLAFSVKSLGSRNSPTQSSDQERHGIDRSLAVAVTAALLLTPLGWVYYVFFFVGPFVALMCRNAWWKSRVRIAGFALALVSLSLAPGILASGQPSGWATLSIGSGYFWGVFLLWALSLQRLESQFQVKTLGG
jgi:hypothetical protein